MATAFPGLRLTARSCCCTRLSTQHIPRSIDRQRQFSTTPAPRISKEEQQKRYDYRLSVASKNMGMNVKAMIAEEEEMKREIQQLLDEDVETGPPMPIPDLPVSRKKLKETFLNMGEVEPFEDGGFMEDEEDDISSLAHGELEQHREWRHYARLAAWEMPLLSSMFIQLISQNDSMKNSTNTGFQNWPNPSKSQQRRCHFDLDTQHIWVNSIQRKRKS